MALGEPCTILPKDGRKVSKGRRRPLESAIDGELPRGIRDVVIAADHMRDLHQMIVDDYGVIVSGIAVRPDEHRIADDLAWKAGRPVNQIVPGKGAFLNLQADGGWLAGRSPAHGFFTRQAAAPA